MPVRRTKKVVSSWDMPWQFWGKQAMVVTGITYGWQLWGSRAISILGITRDVIAAELLRGKFWGLHGISLLESKYNGSSGENMWCQFWGPFRILGKNWIHLHLVLGSWTVTRLFVEFKQSEFSCSTVFSDSFLIADKKFSFFLLCSKQQVTTTYEVIGQN